MKEHAATAPEWIGAIGPVAATFTAIGIALWAERRERARRPSLSLAYDPSRDFRAGVPLVGGLESH